MFGHWAGQLAAIERDGIRVEAVGNGEVEAVRVKTAAGVSDLAAPMDVVFLLTKGYQVSGRLAELRRVITSATIVVGAVQNGFAAWSALAAGEAAPGIPIVGETLVASTKSVPGAVRLNYLGVTRVGALRAADAAAAEAAAKLLSSAGLPAEVEEIGALRGLLWTKVMLAAALNPMSIILQVPVSGIVSSAAAMRTVRSAMEEVRVVGSSLGVDLSVDEALAQSRSFGANLPSGLQDFLAGRRTEVEDINGTVVARGKECGAATPVNALLLDLVTALYESADYRVPINR